MSTKAKDLDAVELSFGEKVNKLFTKDLPRWFYDKEDGSIMGWRTPMDWAKVIIYYFCFYCGLVIFFVANYLIILASVPPEPEHGNIYFCTPGSDSTVSGCQDGPRFKPDPITLLGDNAPTTAILDYSLNEPTLSMYPSTVVLTGNYTLHAHPSNFDTYRDVSAEDVSADRSYMYKGIVDEANRASCNTAYPSEYPEILAAIANDMCTDMAAWIIPQNVPAVFSSTIGVAPTEFQPQSWFMNIQSFWDGQYIMTGGTRFLSPKALIKNHKFDSFVNSTSGAVEAIDGPQVDVHAVFFRLNKLWGYVPYDRKTRGHNSIDLAQVVNTIGVKCYFDQESQCSALETGVNYMGETVACDNTNKQSGFAEHANSGTLSRGGSVSISMLSNQMAKASSFPWEGGAFDLSYGALLVTWDVSKRLSTVNAENTKLALRVKCEWGVTQDTGVQANGSTDSAQPVLNRLKSIYAGAVLAEPFGNPVDPVGELEILQAA